MGHPAAQPTQEDDLAFVDLPPVRLVSDANQASAMLHPMRRRLLEQLDKPNSAAGLARKLKLPRQKVNYHLRALEQVGLVQLHSTRRKRNCEERLIMRTARAYLISPHAVGPLSDVPPQDRRDRYSWAYLVASAARILSDLTTLRKRADDQDKHLATFTLETEARVASPAQLNAMLTDISNAVARAVAKYHDESQADRRTYRVVLGSYPKITKDEHGFALEQEKTL